MKLASLKSGGRDGSLIVVSRNLESFVLASDIAATLQIALDDWQQAAPRLNALYAELNEGACRGVQSLDVEQLAAPLPRAFEFVDGSAYLPHVDRVRRARGAEVPESFYVDPLMYQGVSAGFLGPCDPVPVVSEEYGIDFESEIIVITDDVPMAV
ncbi:MAG: FAA hydrolase family protein, partial [Gammaproteobacteria bacterium]|nr:FAA hydrolase family protein [Gammaproteobacteria bacterium]